MMKILVILFALLTFSLSTVTCCVGNISGVEYHQDAEDDCEDGPCDEPCSPFFNCATCTGFSVQEFENLDFQQEQIPTKKIVSISYLRAGEFHDSSFRPPRA
ncbi:hypothetical protein [Leeuwenhoekiella palythoae]|uniref:hypothetical protein n=2 Tax=Leeuwenhoekiella palythoae TaxID=573501 RepID=UPI0035174980